jgi:sugar phosphate isomerase/epimerase
LAEQRPLLKVSLNAYSFNKLLNDAIKERGPGVTLVQVLEFAAKNKFDGFDATGYYFPGYPAVPSEAYVDNLKRRAADRGVGISGTGVRNNFTTSDKAVRDAGVKHIKEWVEVAARLGAPVIRVFADTQMRSQTWETVAKGCTRGQVQEWIADDLRQCADHGKQYGVRIGVQNHGDFLKTGQELLRLVKAAGSGWCGPIVDTGYFKSSDPYIDMAQVAPHALNWQIKQSPFGEDSAVPTDLVRLMSIVRKSGYSGYLPIETLSPRGKPYDPYAVVPEFLKQLRQAIAQTA